MEGLQAGSPGLVLASGSTARRELLEAAGLAFEVKPSSIDEAVIKDQVRRCGGSAKDAAEVLASAKAVSIASPGSIVLGCDQILICGEIWFDKPQDLRVARSHLSKLRGQRHQLVTACVAVLDGAEIWRHVSVPSLTMRSFSDAFLDRYLEFEGAALLQCVGAYRFEGLGMHLFDSVEGEQSAVLGLPMLPLLGFLRGHGVLAA